MKRTHRIAAVSAVAALTIGGATAAIASSDDDGTETPITGEALQRASDAAIAHLGGGEVTETEVDDEESKYEVEVTLPDGREVDVQLDEDFTVVGTEDEDADEQDD